MASTAWYRPRQGHRDTEETRWRARSRWSPAAAAKVAKIDNFLVPRLGRLRLEQLWTLEIQRLLGCPALLLVKAQSDHDRAVRDRAPPERIRRLRRKFLQRVNGPVLYSGVPSEPLTRPGCARQADVAQLVEQLIRNQQVTSSSLVVGSNKILHEVATPARCRLVSGDRCDRCDRCARSTRSCRALVRRHSPRQNWLANASR